MLGAWKIWYTLSGTLKKKNGLVGKVPLRSQKSRITWDLEYPILVHKELLCPHSVLPSVANTICVARAKSQHNSSTAQEEPPAQGLLSGLDFIFRMAQFGLQGPKVSRILHRCRFLQHPFPGRHGAVDLVVQRE